ncbi:MAG: hypothetical protein MJY55_04810 [Bacteroidales bacterium]|nr:hypothetical protein [Bacteroidales bacterium]
MKKTLILLGVAALAVFASCKKEVPQDSLTLVSAPTEVIPVSGTEMPLTIAFNATKAWTASVNAEVKDFVTLTPTSGEAGDNVKVKFTVAANEVNEDRTIIITIKSEGVEPLKVTLTQASPAHFIVNPEGTVEVTKDGAQVTLSINTNCEYTVTDYHDGSFPWQTAVVSEDKKTVTVTIAKNDGYDPRQSYVKFTVNSFEEPVRVYFNQAGSLALVWRQDFTWTPYYSSTPYSTALSGDYILVNTSEGIQVFKQSDGSFVQTISTAPYTLTGITNDDAGNVVASMGGDYPLKEDWSLDEDKQVPLTVAYLPAGSMDIDRMQILIAEYYDEFYGYGLDNIRVTGDVTKDACITMFSGAGAGGHLVFWDVNGGKCAKDAPTDYVTYGGDAWGEGLPAGIWTSRHCVGKSLGNATATGVLAIGYDGNYNLFYNAGVTMTNWQKVLETGGQGNEGFNSIDYIEWNGHKYASTVMMTYFGKVDWAGDGNWSYCPSYLYLLNIDNPAAPVVLSKQACYMTEDNFVYGSTTDVNLVIEGNDLVVYVLDSGISCMAKVKYPKL